MTDDTPEETPKKSGPSKAAIGAAATIGSAAIAAALLYAGKRFKKKPNEPTQPGPIPSGEKPETD
ncbi:isopropylmalate isomerase [uncultured Erythrobacter sp.]|uniref:isopropylmalate isomerase n=1 Tax=uncultured Erythrobacter sp. TaxID=263913 RepID=UPI00261FB046|nr:isopropylmalate isomerase [uncultured Erythrobacter sp.]